MYATIMLSNNLCARPLSIILILAENYIIISSFKYVYLQGILNLQNITSKQNIRAIPWFLIISRINRPKANCLAVLFFFCFRKKPFLYMYISLFPQL